MGENRRLRGHTKYVLPSIGTTTWRFTELNTGVLTVFVIWAAYIFSPVMGTARFCIVHLRESLLVKEALHKSRIGGIPRVVEGNEM